jgi:hypothetical protein
MAVEVMEKSMAVPNRKMATLDGQDGDGSRTYTNTSVLRSVAGPTTYCSWSRFSVIQRAWENASQLHIIGILLSHGV